MSRHLYAIALSFAFMWLAGPIAVSAQATSDRDRIRFVLDEYVSGWRDGDVERLARVFATEEGRILWLTGSAGNQNLASMTFAQALQGRKPQPEYGRRWKLLALDVVEGQLAVAKLEISHNDGSYIDYLTLHKIAGDWRIVAKTFVWKPLKVSPSQSPG